MQFYHLDRLNTFPDDPAQQILPIKTCNTLEVNDMACSFYPNGISKTGHRYLSPFNVNLENYDAIKATWADARIFTIEYAFEMARLHSFRNRPSRFESLFACQTPEDVSFWYNVLKNNSPDIPNASVKIIETGNNFFIGDAFWRDMPLSLDGQDVFSPFAYYAWAYKYWSGVFLEEKPKTEVLCRLPVIVKDSIPVSDFLSDFV